MKFFSSTLLLLSVSAGVAAQDAHEHGHARINIVIQGSAIEMEFVSPAVNILGFEHSASTEDEHNIVAEAEKILLSKKLPLFAFTPEAECLPTQIALEAPESAELLEEESHQHDHHDHASETHNDIHIHYVYSCNQPDKLAGMNTQLFNKFPSLHELDVQLLTSEKQISKHLDEHHSDLAF